MRYKLQMVKGKGFEKVKKILNNSVLLQLPPSITIKLKKKYNYKDEPINKFIQKILTKIAE